MTLSYYIEYREKAIIIAITAAGVVPCGGPKKSPRTSSTVQIMFEISEGILRNQQIIIGLDSFSNQRLINLAPFGFVMYDSYMLKDVHSVLVNFPREYAQESMMLYI